MDSGVIAALRARSDMIRDRWERLLRVERVSGPLANPDALLYYIPTTLEKVLGALINAHRRAVSAVPSLALRRPACSCGHNPYLAYYVAGEQALLESLVLVQTELRANGDAAEQAAILKSVIRTIASQEIETFCGICTHQGTVSGCIRRAPGGNCAKGSCDPAGSGNETVDAKG